MRKFNVAGAHSSGMMGEAPRSRATHLIPQLCRVAAGEAGELIVHGDDWDTADGTGVRDYVHVQDLADGFVRALRHVAANPGLLTVNLGSGTSHSVLGVLAAFERACGRSIPRIVGARRPGDVGGKPRRHCARRRNAGLAPDARPRRDLRRRVAMAEERRPLLTSSGRRDDCFALWTPIAVGDDFARRLSTVGIVPEKSRPWPGQRAACWTCGALR